MANGLHFAMVMDSYGKWAFPKGHVQPGERYKEAAVREIREEMGLVGLTFLARLDTIDIWFRDRFVHKGELIHKFIHYFLFEAPADAILVPPIPQGNGEHIRDVAWVHVDELMNRSSYKDMVGIIRKAIRLCGLPSSKMSKTWVPKGR
jgi:8-oxo-dGTP diphosphatase